MEKNMINPDHPVYIVSKGRSDTMITSKSLSRNNLSSPCMGSGIS